VIQNEVSEKEQRLSEMSCSYQATDAQLQTCLSIIAEKAEQLLQLDQQVSAVDTSGTIHLLCCIF